MSTAIPIARIIPADLLDTMIQSLRRKYPSYGYAGASEFAEVMAPAALLWLAQHTEQSDLLLDLIRKSE